MKQKIGIQRACFAVLVLAVTLAGCGASSDVTSSTETSLAEMPLCATLESNLEKISEFYIELAVEVANFRTGALLPSGPEKQIAEWFCEMSERFPGQMNYADPNDIYRLQPLGWHWGTSFLRAQLGNYENNFRTDVSRIVEKPWGNPNTYADDVFPGCEPGLGLRTSAIPDGILANFPLPGLIPISEPNVFRNTVAPGAIRAIKNGTFNEYKSAVTEEWELTFASDLLYPPKRSDPPYGTTQDGYLMERLEARLIDAGNLLYIKVVCPEIWAELSSGIDGLASYLDSLAASLTQPTLKFLPYYPSWPTHRGVVWSQLFETEIYNSTGCNFERLSFESTSKTDDPKWQGYLGFECGLDPDLASHTLSDYKKFAGPSFVYVYNDPASRDVAIQRRKASDYNFEYDVAYCGELNFPPFVLPYVAYFKSAEVIENWRAEFDEYKQETYKLGQC